jgi:4-amino-4-deoxy-L-arabinose transferase-like glycosyltransferase
MTSGSGQSSWLRRPSCATLLTLLVLAALGYLLSWRLAEAASLDYDEGVYLMSARLLLHGRAMFTEVFSSQPPFFLDLLHGALRLFGDSVGTGRAVCVIAAVATCGLTGLVAGARVGTRAAPAATFLCGASLLLVRQARTVQAELPALALAMAAMACLADQERARRFGWRLGAGALMGLALATKLLVAPIGLPVAMAAVEWRRGGARSSVRAVATISAAAILAVLAVSAPHGLRQVWDQSVTFHLVARSGTMPAVLSATPWRNLFTSEALLLVLAVMGALVLRARDPRLLAWLGIWLGATAAFLVGHAPLFTHHMIILVPPLAVLASGLAEVMRWRGLALAGIVAAALVKGAGGLAPRLATSLWAEALTRTTSAEETRAVEALRSAARPEELVVTDRQMLAYLAGRDVPASLCDTSFVRIATGSLTPDVALAESKRARAVLLWTGRLARLEGYQEWLRTGAIRAPWPPADDAAGRGLFLLREER